MLACKTRKWGNSVGLVIPKKVVEELRIGLNEEIFAEFKKKENPLKELFGALKFDKPTKQILKEVRREMESKYLR